MQVWVLSWRKLMMALLPVLVIGYLALSHLFAQPRSAGKIIVVDAGHGGIDPGANRSGILEKDINLDITLAIRDMLKNNGVKVVLTRDTDVDLSGLCDNERVRGRYRRDLNARIEMIQESDADLFVSVHTNASYKTKRRGFECFYSAKSEQGKRLAVAIQEQLRRVAPISQEAEPADFFVLRRNKVPAVLVEVGFITNPEERALLQSNEYQRKLANAIAFGISDYYKSAFLPSAKF
ncbi:MAG: cell wall hydrolase/autolysin [Firmicutes bacterium]|nr:cell wall hydrolase/autolysin [Bacillota bacterium]